MRSFAPLVALALSLGFSTPARAVKCPNMYIVLDRSGSMETKVTESQTRWQSALAAVRTFTTATVAGGIPRQQIMRFGLMVFPEPVKDSCSKGKHLVTSDFFTAADINARLGGIAPGGMTPIGDSIKAARARPELSDPSRKSYVLLITDGEPNCKNEQGVSSSEGLSYAVQEVTALANAAVKTFVIGFGSGVDPTGLNKLAEAGRTPRAGSRKYYEANDTTSLNAAFDAIATVTQGELGASTCDDSCYTADGACPTGKRCQANIKSYPGGFQLNLGQCVDDPCAGMSCGTGEFCRDGTCRSSCESGCDAFQACKDGACVDDPCAQGCTCSPACDKRQQCVSGNRCIDPPCAYITCPAGFECKYDSCYNPMPITPDFGDAGPGSGGGSDAGSDSGDSDEPGGCGCSSAGGGPLLLTGLVAAGIWRRRRRPAAG